MTPNDLAFNSDAFKFIAEAIETEEHAFSLGLRTVRPFGLHKIARNAIQIVAKSRRYLCIAWPSEWQGDE